MKKIPTKINHLQLIPERHYTLLFILIAIILASTLVNNPLFISGSLTAYFLYTIFASIFITVTSSIFLMSGQRFRSGFPLPALLFLSWLVYILIHGLLISGVLNIWHSYFIISCLLFISLFISGQSMPSAGQKFFTLITLLAVIESLICIFQYLRWVPGNNRFFTVTGTLGNPNVTAMFLAMSFPAVLSLLFTTKKVFKKMTVVACMLLTVALFLLNCRTAFAGSIIASAIVLNAQFHWLQWLKGQKTLFLKVVLFFAITASILAASYYAYQYKKKSADGRKLVWKLSLGMIKAKPFSGYGYGMFEREYNLTQAVYFKSGSGSAQEKEDADYVHMAYNEFIQNAVEGGIPGMLLFTGIVASLLLPPLIKTKSVNNHNNVVTSVISSKNGADDSKTSSDKINANTAYSGIMVFTLMSVLNFTIQQAIPVLCLFIIYAAFLTTTYFRSSYNLEQGNLFRLLNYRITFRPVWNKIVFSCFIAAGIYLFISQGSMASAYFQNKKAAVAVKNAAYNEALEILKPLGTHLSTSDSYWQNYGRLLFLQKKYIDASIMFNKAKVYTSAPSVYMQTGYCYEYTGQYTKAAREFEIAGYIQPNHLTPRYALMNLYINENDTAHTLMEAKVIIANNPKVPSVTVDLYKKEANSVVRRFSKSPINSSLTKL